MDPDPQIRQDLLDVLGDLPQWRLSGAAWQVVAEALEKYDEAAAREGKDALVRLTVALETLSPPRILPLDLSYPPPPPLRLRANRLVHALTEQPLPLAAASTRSAAPPDGVTGIRQELVVHAFAALTGPWAEPAYQQVRNLWRRACEVLGVAEPAGTPEPPADGLLLAAGPILATGRRPDRTAQVVLRREHDAVVLSIGWIVEPGTAGPGWAECERQWSEIAQDDTGELLCVVRVRSGLVAAEGNGGLFSGQPWEFGESRAGPCTLWELPPFNDHRRQERTLLVLAPESDETVLSALVWSDRSPALPPLARYLLDAAKLRYELRVRDAADPALHEAMQAGAESAVDLLATHVDDMRLTAGIARSNMAQTVPGAGGLFDDDRELADWLTQILDDDLRYLGNARKRGSYRAPAAAVDAGAIGVITAMPEEYAAMAALLDQATEQVVDGDTYLIGTVPSAVDGRPHPVVLTLLGGTANNDAAANVAHLVRSHPAVQEILMVGIAAGVPRPDRPEIHVRLGDIVAATWGFVEFDHVVDRPDGHTLRAGPPRPSYRFGKQADMLEAGRQLDGSRAWEDALDRLVAQLPDFGRPTDDTDVLYASDEPDALAIAHPPLDLSGHRAGRPKVHHGRIGSSNRSLRHAHERDKLAATYDIRAIEMEGAGVAWAAHAASRGWFIVRGISDYADRRMNTDWRRYASTVAAAYAHALLGRLPPLT
jgi:nucleoside phosphorylase